MSTTNPDPDTDQTLDERVSDQYRVTEGVEPSDASVGGSDHPISQALGDKDHYEFEYDPRATGISIAERYDEPAAALREYIHNSETACIRRIRKELIDIGYTEDEVLDMSLDEARVKAEEEAGYVPSIEIEHHWPGSDSPALTIRDNGIGIAVEEFVVMKKHAHSTSFLDGSVGGQFGQGIYSIFMLVGPEGEGKFETKSRLDDASYGMRIRITGFNKMPGSRDSYGTTFTFPALSEEGKETDIGGKIEEYCQGIRVPVQYEEYDERGNHVFQEDWVPTKLEDDYDESAPIVTYETKYFRAVASPEAAKGNRSPKTLLTSMPIERNDSRYSGTANNKFESPWKFDIRLNYEDGRIAFGPHAGLVPVEDKTYEKMDEDRQEHYIPMSETVTDDLAMPKPVDDRDRLRDGAQGFFKRVSEGLSRAFADQYAAVLADVDEFEDIATLDPRERTLFLRGYSHFGPSMRRSDADNIQETLEEEVGVTVPTSVCEKLSVMKRDVLTVPRDCSDPSKKGGRHARNRTKKKVWRVIADTEPDADVYMGKTVSNKKANLAWEIHEDNVVVQLDDDTAFSRYSKPEKLFGWKKLKDLPSRNLGEKFPSLSDEFLDEWDSVTTTSTSSGSGRGSYDRDRAKKRRIKVRIGVGRSKFKRHKAEDVYDALDNGNTVKAKSYSGRCSELIVVDQNEHGVSDFSHLCGNGIAMAVVPSYVREYLLEADNVYTPEGIQRAHGETWLDFDWTRSSWRDGEQVSNLTKNDIVLIVRKDNIDLFRERVDRVRDIVDDWLDENASGYDAGDMTSFTLVTGSQLNDCWLAFRRGDGAHISDANVRYTSSREVTRSVKKKNFGYSDGELFWEVELPSDEYDRDTPEWKRMIGTSPSIDETTRNVATMLRELGDCTDDEVFPSQRGDDDDS